MYLCYIDESGTPEVPGNTSHFVLAGLAIPVARWKEADQQVSQLLSKYDLGDAEIHTAWMLRLYPEQKKIPNFEKLSRANRRIEVTKLRVAELLRLQKKQKHNAYKQAKKNYAHTDAYIHLTHDERKALIKEVADLIGSWQFARLFAECIDKIHFDPVKAKRSVAEQGFEQVVSRFEHYLKKMPNVNGQVTLGLLVHDNNQTEAKKHTAMMKDFHTNGTLWTKVERIIETPLFVDSKLTRMVQLADLCSYSIRRFLENSEKDLFDRVFVRADRYKLATVGVRHYTKMSCKCAICIAHG